MEKEELQKFMRGLKVINQTSSEHALPVKGL